MRSRRSSAVGAVTDVLLGLFVISAMSACTARIAPEPDSAPAGTPLQWSELPSLPDPKGFAGAYVGVSGDALIVAGGANFPKGSPWDGDPKVWYDRIYVLAQPDGAWQLAGQRLPRPMGYGVSVTYRDSVVCVGGDDGRRQHADAFMLRWTGGSIETTELPPLPRPVANACGAIVGHTLYVAGGTPQTGAASALNMVWALDLDVSPDERAWREIGPWPGPARMLAAAGAHDGAFYLFAGTDLYAGEGGVPARKFLADAYRFKPGEGWKRLADLPRPSVAPPTPAPTVAGRLLVIGGDTGEFFTRNSQLRDKHPGFPSSILAYDVATDTWSAAGDFPKQVRPDAETNPNASVWPPVTTGTAVWKGRIVVPTGEARPGVRTPRVFWATAKTAS